MYVGECSQVVESASDSEDSFDDEIPKKMTFQEAYNNYALNL